MARVGENRVGTALAKHGYKELKKVGEGSFGAAILAMHSSDKDKDTKAIVKMIDISRASKSEKDDALKESQVLSSLKHPYIVRYRESFHEDGWLCIVMDYAEGGDLSDKLKKTRAAGKTIPQDQVLRWFTQSILALKYIHDMHILHRDLKSGNFFLSKSGNIKMGDFGIAKVLECTAACAQTQIGTPYYLSPEICKGKPYAWSSDIWSMGCILYEMCARKVPFDAPDLRQLIQKITKGPAPEVPSEYSVALRNLCKELLDLDPVKRPPAADILKKPVVQEMVRRMLDEVKGDEEPASGDKSGGGAASAKPAPKTGTGQKYQKNDAVEYYSETHGEWLPASITNTEDSGRVQLNVKPGVWLSVEVQTAKVRPRQNGGGASQPQQSANDARPPAGPAAASAIGGASPSQPTRPAAAARADSGRRGNDPPQQAGGVRAASPRRDAPQSRERGSSQDRGPRRSSTPQRQGSAGGQTPAAAGAPTSSRGASPSHKLQS